jgi:hypothetical protein
MARESRESAGRGLHHAAVCLLLAAALAVTLFALAWTVRRPDSLRALPAVEYALLLGGQALAAASAALALVKRARAWRDGSWTSTSALPFRIALWVGIPGWLVYLCCFQPFKALYLVLVAGILAGVFALGVLAAERIDALLARRGARILDRLLTSACLTVLFAELLLRSVASFSDQRIFERLDDPADVMERYRMESGRKLFGFPCNSRGYYDEEPARGSVEPRLVVIGDSFSVGIVPHAYHYTTVCERLMPGRALDNLGINSCGPAEYLRMLVEDGLPLEPAAVIVALFVGNDIVDAERYAPPQRLLRAWFDRANVLLFVVPERLAAIRAEERASDGAGAVASVAGMDEEAPVGESLEELALAFPWLADPSLEVPTFSEAKFLEIESGRALQVCRPGAVERYASVEAALREMRQRAGSIPFLVMLLPDEFQVEEDLWRDVVSTDAAIGELARDQPQEVLGSWLAAEGIPCLDLLPALRNVPRGADGRRHLYGARDTHLNARGNRIAGEELARFLLARGL